MEAREVLSAAANVIPDGFGGYSLLALPNGIAAVTIPSADIATTTTNKYYLNSAPSSGHVDLNGTPMRQNQDPAATRANFVNGIVTYTYTGGVFSGGSVDSFQFGDAGTNSHFNVFSSAPPTVFLGGTRVVLGGSPGVMIGDISGSNGNTTWGFTDPTSTPTITSDPSNSFMIGTDPANSSPALFLRPGVSLTSTSQTVTLSAHNTIYPSQTGSSSFSIGAINITTQPQSQTVNVGQAATLTVGATPSSGYQVGYFWQTSPHGANTFTEAPNDSATATYTTPATTQAGQKDYNVDLFLYVSNPNTDYLNGDVFTSIAVVTAQTGTTNTAPAITTNPTNQAATVGNSVTFTAAASGSPTPTAQWQVSTNGGSTFTDIAGATSGSYTFTAAPSQAGNQYRAVFTNTAGSATSTAATFTLNAAPVVTTNPTNQTATAGQNVTFTAAANGNPTPTVQWQVSTNGGSTYTNVAGATSSSLTFSTSTGQNGNLYHAVFTNSVSSATTTAATLTVNAATVAPLVTTNPTNQTATAGNSVTFTAAASGTPTPTVQWQVSSNGGSTYIDVGGATSASLTFTASAAQMGTQYRAVFTNSVSSATTTAATLTVNVAPAITTNPTDQTATAGSSVTFTAAANGNPTPTAQWQVSSNGGSTYTDISGATSPSFTFTTTAAQNGRLYRAVFTNSVSAATTTAATLTVNVAPAITTNPTDQTVNAGSSVTFTAAASGNPTPTVQWQVSSNGGSTYTDIPGATAASFTFTTTAAQNGRLYRAVFTNSVNSATTSAATLTVNVAPAITTNPTDQTVTAGNSVTFTAAASGNPTPTVQWQVSSNGGSTYFDISGATSASLTFTATAAQNGRLYQAVFTNSVGSATSNAATLTVQTAPVFTSGAPTSSVGAGQSYSFLFSASGNPTPTLSASGLPAFLSFNPASGVLSGSTTVAGTYSNIQITATNGIGVSSLAFNLTVTPGVAAALAVTGPQAVTAGTSYNYTITAQDQYGNTATGYTNTATLSTTDSFARLPAGGTVALTNGVGTAAVTFRSGGSFALSASGTNLATGQLSPIVSNVTATLQNGVVVDDDALASSMGQRSMVRYLTVTFQGDVVPSAGQFSLLKMVNGVYTTSIGLAVGGATLVNGNTQLKLTFSDPSVVGTSLADGRYQLSYQGTALTTFFRLYGDINGDGQVDPLIDQKAFTDAANTRRGTSIKYNQYFDYYNLGAINATDNSPFQARSGKKLDMLGNVVVI